MGSPQKISQKIPVAKQQPGYPVPAADKKPEKEKEKQIEFTSSQNPVYYTNTDGVRFADSPGDWNSPEHYNHLPKGAQVRITDHGSKESFNAVSEEMKWVKVQLLNVPFKKSKYKMTEIVQRQEAWLMKKYLSYLPQDDKDAKEDKKEVFKDPYPAAPNAFHGIAPYLMAFEKQTPEFEFSIAINQIAAGDFMLTPNCVNIGGKTHVLYYTATDYSKGILNAYIVGPDKLQQFTKHAAAYSHIAKEGAAGMESRAQWEEKNRDKHVYHADPYNYAEYSSMAVQCGMNGDWDGYWRNLGMAWKVALKDPGWVMGTAVSVGTSYVLVAEPAPVKGNVVVEAVVVAETSTNVLKGAVKSNYGRFVKDMPVNAKGGSSWKLLDDGNYLFEATSPATNIPGSKAVYQKWVNPQGETVKMIKTTYAPDGSIVHIKSKF